MNRMSPCPLLPVIRFCLGVLPGFCATAGAAIIKVDMTATPLEIPNSLDGLYLNFVTGASSTAAVPPTGWDFNPYNRGDGLAFFSPDFPAGQGMLASGSTALALLGGETIGNTSLYQSGQVLGTPFHSSGVRFTGLRFLNEATGQINYGWAQLASTGGGTAAGFPASLLGYAYDNTGASLTAGQVPEPHSTWMLAIPGLALLFRRKGRPA